MSSQTQILSNEKFISPELFTHGEKFYNSYKTLESIEGASIPSLVCLAFSIEIFLKSLSSQKIHMEVESYTEGLKIYESSDKSDLGKGHNLLDLLEKLPSETQEEISLFYHRKYFGDIKSDLNLVKTGFMDWRYMYEGKTTIVHVSKIQNIGESIYSYIKEKLHP